MEAGTGMEVGTDTVMGMDGVKGKLHVIKYFKSGYHFHANAYWRESYIYIVAGN